MKNKLIVMFLTFIIMIALTPFIFNKLMNSRFNTMILKLSQQNGIQIKEIKNKSTYLTTDRVFKVIVPGSAIDQKEIKYIELLTEARFKNLPVTNVEFLSTVKKIVLENNKTIPFENKVKILVITPDFKVYKYRLFDNKIDLKNNTVFSWKNFNGVFDEKNKILKNANGLIQIKNNINDFKVYNIQAFLQNKSNKKVQQLHFDVNFSNPKFNFQVLNFNAKSDLKINNDKINIHSTSNCEKIEANNMFKLSDINSLFELKGIDANIYKKLQSKKYSQKDIDKMLKDGFRGKFDLYVKDVFFLQDLGFVNLKSNFTIKNASVEKINNNDLSFLDLNVSLETSPKLINFAGNLFPPLKSMVKIQNNKALLNLAVNKGNISINGNSIKSR